MRNPNERIGTVIILVLAAATFIAGCMRNGKRDPQRRPDGGRIVAAAEKQDMPDSPDLCGTYGGTIPAADCPGIDVTVEIGRDGTFRMVYDYVDRDGVFESAGRYELRGNRLIAVDDGSDSTIFRMEGDRLRMLDSRGEAITGPLEDMFILEKRRPGSE